MDKNFLYEMLTTQSVSGNEQNLEHKIYDYMQGKADRVESDELSNVIACVNPEAEFKVLMTGHADEIGLMITAVTSEGMLKVRKVGGVPVSCYPGHKVRVYTKDGILYGAVVRNSSIAKNKDLEASDLTIDIGASSKDDALAHVRLGDVITIDTDYRELLNDRITGRALDDRVGAFIVMQAIAQAKEKGAAIGAYAATTTGEETSMNGAYFTASRVKPNIAIAVDVTYTSDYPGVDSADTGDVQVGKGPVLCNAPAIHKIVNEKLAAAAEKRGIAVQWEAAGGRTGTDGDVMHKSGIGVPVALVSIPLRYMHCPDEVVSLKDVQDCIDLLAQFLCDCTQDMSLKYF